MRDEYDFKNAKRGPVLPVSPGKTRITIRLDDDILQWFKDEVDNQGGGSYQTLINAALREYINSEKESMEEVLRRVLREELKDKAS